ncbi:MAG: carbohydrate ABC transporter permease [Spirochaetales bacterium]|nr:carbohydrate ABC transporter permease [Spirochaetales bacterium]
MGRRTKHLWVHLALSVAVLVISAPLLFAAVKATQDRNEVLSPRMVPGDHLVENIRIVWNDQELGTYIGNSLWIALSVTVGKTVLSILAAMVLVYFHIRFKGIIFGFVLFTLLMPTEVLIVGLFDLVSLRPPESIGELVRWAVNPRRVLLEPVPFGLGWTNRYASIIVPFMASATGVFLFRQHFLSIPRDLGDAARIDGAGPWNFLLRVLIPLSGNTIGALALIQFVYVWDQYLWPRVIIRDDSRQVVQVGLNLIIGVGEGVYWGQVMAGSLISIVPPLVVFIALQEQFMRGFALTADK